VFAVLSLSIASKGLGSAPRNLGGHNNGKGKEREQELSIVQNKALTLTPTYTAVSRDSKHREKVMMLSALKARGEVASLLEKHGGWSCIVGGIISHLIFGTLYCWSNFQSYAPPHLKFFDGKDRMGSPDSMLVFPLTLVAQCFAMPFGTMVVKQIGSRATMLLGVAIVASGVFFAS